MITIKEVDDWVTVWKGQELVFSSHSCPLDVGLGALDIPFKREYREFLEDDNGDAQDWLDTPPEVEA